MQCKSYSHFFSKKFQHIWVSLDVNFNESLTNDIVSFEQLGPVSYNCNSRSNVFNFLSNLKKRVSPWDSFKSLLFSSECIIWEFAELFYLLAYPTWVRRENSGLDSGGAEHPKGRFGKDGTFYNRTPRRNPNKGLKKKKKKTTEEHGSDDPLPFGTASGMKDGHPLFTASVYQLRYCILWE